MQQLLNDVEKFQAQLQLGAIQRAYRALLAYMMQLQTHFKKYPQFTVSSLYQGYMDMTYFAVSTPQLKQHELKLAIVFNFESFNFEAWLAGRNRNVNQKYWPLLKNHTWPGYRIISPGKGVDSILECDLALGFDPDNTPALTSKIETGVKKFLAEIEEFLSNL